MEPVEIDAAILGLLRDAPAPGIVSLPRIAKRLEVSASTLMRQLTLMGDAEIGGRRGPCWVRVVREEDRWVVSLTPAGRSAIGGGD